MSILIFYYFIFFHPSHDETVNYGSTIIIHTTGCLSTLNANLEIGTRVRVEQVLGQGPSLSTCRVVK